MNALITVLPEPAVASKVKAKSASLPPQIEGMSSVLSMLLDETPQGLLVIDGQGCVSYANLAMSVLFPMRSVQLQVRLSEQPGLESISALMQEALQLKRRVQAEVRVVFNATPQTHEERVYHAVAAPLTELNPPGAWVMVDDMTERAFTELVRKDFVTNASHELRTPLSLIHGYIETLKSGLIKGGTSLNRCLEVMEKHSKRMMRIIEDMLTISRLESGDAQLKTEIFLVRNCVEDVLEHLTPLIETSKPGVKLSFPSKGGFLTGDRFYWDQIFSNLIENALKENSDPGLQISIKGEWEDDECVLTIADNGIGIPVEDVPFVFKRFFRCAKHHSQDVRGTGLGLSIVKRAVEAHGGSIELRSQPRIETAFIIRVPLHPEDRMPVA